MKLARRMQRLEPSATLTISARAKELKTSGRDVIGFGAGEPDFDTPEPIVEAMVVAARAGATRYAPVAGLPPLREAVARWFTRLYGCTFEAAEVMVTVGGKQALYNLFQALVDEGDEVLVPAPYWVSYPQQIRLAGGEPVVVPTHPEEGFRLRVEDVDAAITERTRGLLINSPGNPSGAVQSAEDLGQLAELAARRDLWIITDDIYSELRYEEGPFANVLKLRPDLRERIIVVHGCSKTYAMTGWRLGFVGAPRSLIEKLSALMGQTTSGPTTFAQKGALAAIEGDHAFLEGWLAAYDARRRRIVGGLEAIEGIRCAMPGGAFYVFPDLRGLMGRRHGDAGITLTDDLELCELLLEDALVACVPGTPFGAPGFMRMSYACSMDDIDRGLERITAFCAALA